MSKIIYAIGDSHGMLDCMKLIRGKILLDSQSYDEKTVVYLGDYIDRGPSSFAVVDELIRHPLPGFTEHHLRGNHEDFIIKSLLGIASKDEAAAWLYHGGKITLRSYGINIWTIIPDNEALLAAYKDSDFTFMYPDFLYRLTETLREIPQYHIDFFKNLALYHEEDGYLFVHAGIDPYLDLEQQGEQEFLWIREDFLEYTGRMNWRVVHGHTISPEVELLANRIGVDTGAFQTGRLSAVALEAGKRPRIIDTRELMV